MNSGGDWVPKKFHFDNIGKSMINLYQVATLDGYGAILFNAIRSVGVDMAPQYKVFMEFSIYIMIIIVFLSYILMNVFNSVIISQFKV